MTLLRLASTIAFVLLAGCAHGREAHLPEGFVYLADVDASIVQDMRYATAHNFTGAVVPGYEAGRCILTRQAAEALARAQAAVKAQGFTLIVWECYRPVQAVKSFVAWAQGPDESAKAEFYPRVPKSELFERGYIASRSRHSSGSTVDLGLAPAGLTAAPPWQAGMAQEDCTAPYGERFMDGTVDLGTGYDCFDGRSHVDATDIGTAAKVNRVLLGVAMATAGFQPYAEEWWHFTLKDELFRDQGFDFPVR
jgi:D-alanyl-D-alanine dipeptidase